MKSGRKVAVSQRVDIWADRGERRDALDQRLCQWLALVGWILIPVPNTLSTSPVAVHDREWQSWLAVVRPDAVLLSGGNDIGKIDERDKTERRLLDYASDRALPALGLCRGMQMMALWAGGSLLPVSNHVRTRHRLQGVTDSASWPEEVNSFHEVAVAESPPGFIVTARAEDGTIEAMRHETLPWEGWMWHPEREPQFDPADMMRFRLLRDLKSTF